nr:hypothetical protein [Clostridia bacterium]
MTPLEKAYAKMTPEQRKAATESISEMMGMPEEEKKSKKDMNEDEAFLDEDEIKAQQRFVDQPGQWIDVTPPEVKEKQAEAWKNLQESLDKK